MMDVNMLRRSVWEKGQIVEGFRCVYQIYEFEYHRS